MNIQHVSFTEQGNYLQPYLLEGAFAQLDENWRLQIQGAPYSRLYYFTTGEAWLEFAGERIPLRAGWFYLLPAGLPFSAGCDGMAEKYYFHLTLLKRDGYDLVMELRRPICHPFSKEKQKRLEELCTRQNLCKTLCLKQLLLEDVLAGLESAGIGNDDETNYSLAVQRTIRHIRRNLSARLSVRALAEQVYLSERTLNNTFHRELGKSVGRYIDEMLLFEAQRRLLFTTQSIAEIGENLGFCDSYYFSRRFKELCGKTPTQYRKSERNY